MSVTIIKADPGYFIVEGIEGEGGYGFTSTEPIIAWEIEHRESPEQQVMIIVAIGIEGSLGPSESYYTGRNCEQFHPMAIKYPDGKYYDGTLDFADEKSLLEMWNQIKTRNEAKRAAA